jgi:hypothetical protein
MASGSRHDASDWPVQPPAGTSWYGSKVGLEAVPPVYGTFGAHRDPPI